MYRIQTSAGVSVVKNRTELSQKLSELRNSGIAILAITRKS